GRLVIEAETIRETVVVDVRENQMLGCADRAGERAAGLVVFPLLLVLRVAPADGREELVVEVEIGLRVGGVAVGNLIDVLDGRVFAARRDQEAVARGPAGA